MKKTSKIKRVLALCLIFLLSINSFAAIVSDNDGSAFVTKAEFDALKASFNKQVDDYNASIDGKIDGAIAQYLGGLALNTTEMWPLYANTLLKNSKDGIANKAPTEIYKFRLPPMPKIIYDFMGMQSVTWSGTYYPDWSLLLSSSVTDVGAVAFKRFSHIVDPDGGLIFADTTGNISNIYEKNVMNILWGAYSRYSYGSGDSTLVLVDDNWGEKNNGFSWTATTTDFVGYGGSYDLNARESSFDDYSLKWNFGKDKSGNTVTQERTNLGTYYFVCDSGTNVSKNFPCTPKEYSGRYNVLFGSIRHLSDTMDVKEEPFYMLNNTDSLWIANEDRQKVVVHDPMWINRDAYRINKFIGLVYTDLPFYAGRSYDAVPIRQHAYTSLFGYKTISGSWNSTNVTYDGFTNCLKNTTCSLATGLPLFTADRNASSVEFSFRLEHTSSSDTSKKYVIYVLDDKYNTTDKFTNALNISINGISDNKINAGTDYTLKIPNVVKDKNYYLFWMSEGYTYGGKLVDISQDAIATVEK